MFFPTAPIRRRKPASPLPLQLRMEMIARPAAGKTTLLTAINETCEGTHLPSGLHFGVDDPLAANQLMQLNRARQAELQGDNGLGSTQMAEPIRYQLQAGDQTVIEFLTHEVVGQVLTGTNPDSPPPIRQMYDRYVEKLKSADALLAMIPAPIPDDNEAGRARYREDLRLTNAYLREAIKHHNHEAPCAVAIVVTKLDALFEREQEARSALTDDVLRSALGPVVQTVLHSTKVREAVIIPTSGFGFGRSEVIEESTHRDKDHGVLHRLVGEQNPFNVTGLLVWTLFHGLLPKEVQSGEQELAIQRTIQMLSSDIEAVNPWLVPIKTRGAAVC